MTDMINARTLMAPIIDLTPQLETASNAMTLTQEPFTSSSVDHFSGRIHEQTLDRQNSGASDVPTLATCTSASSSPEVDWFNDTAIGETNMRNYFDESVSGGCDTDLAYGDTFTALSYNVSEHKHYQYPSCMKCTITEEEARRFMAERRKEQNRLSQRRFRQRKQVRLVEATKQIAFLQEQVKMLQGCVDHLRKVNWELQSKVPPVESASDRSVSDLTSPITVADTPDRFGTRRNSSTDGWNTHGEESLFLLDSRLGY